MNSGAHPSIYNGLGNMARSINYVASRKFETQENGDIKLVVAAAGEGGSG